MGFFKSLFGGSNTPETEKEKNDKKNFEILKYDGIRARHMGKLPYAIKCFEEAVAINDEMETLTLLANAYIQANRLDDARITFNRMAEKEPEQVNTFLSLASICFMQEDYEGMNRCLPKGTCFRRQESADLLSHCQGSGGNERRNQCHCHADQSNCLKRRLYGGIPITC